MDNIDPIIFQVIDWSQFHESDEDSSESDSEQNSNSLLKYKIRLYGRTINNESIFVNVEDFTPFFYVEVPLDWNTTKCLSLISYIKNKISNENNLRGFKNFEIIQKKKFNGFTDYKNFKFIKLIFLNMKSLKSFEYWILNNKIFYPSLFKNPCKLQIYESNIEPFIRCMHIQKLNACGWIIINKYIKYEDDITYCDINIKTNWTNLKPYENNKIQKFIIASYDIECMSESGNFPQASNDKDQIIQIGTVFSYYGESEPFHKNIITLGGCTQVAGLEDVEIISYNDEKKVLLAWTKLIQKYNPDIITGYNINGFDFIYMRDRAKKCNIFEKFSLLSKYKNEISVFKEKALSSSALGDNLLKYFDMNGRIIIDLMKVLQRDTKLDSYKLDHVASHYIKEKIVKYDVSVDNKNIGIIYTESIYGIKKEDYINISFNDGLTENKHDVKYKIINLEKLSNDDIELEFGDKKFKNLYKMDINGIISDEIFFTDGKKNKVSWCHAKDDISPKDLFRFFRGSNDDRGIIAKYCIMDCVLVTKLMEKLQILNNNIGMANVCHVPLSYIFMRGQGIKVFSLVLKKCRELDHLIPKLIIKNKPLENKEFKKIKDDEEVESDEIVGYEGATVFPPVKGVHYEPIPVLDYASLYPRSMISVNISNECIIKDTSYENLENYTYQTVTYNNNDGTTNTCKFAKKKDGSKGILPLILIELLEKRSATKKLMEKAEDVFLKNIYDGMQLAYKVTANSLYGQVGAPTSSIYMKELAASTTATGRKMLEFSRDFIEGTFGNLINLALTDKNEYYKNSLDLYKDISPEKFIEPKVCRNNVNDFIEYFYEKINNIISQEYRVKPKVIYGDSVTPDIPILLLNNNNSIEVKKIQDIGKLWSDYNVFKSNTEGLTNKQQDNNINYKVWTDQGWSKIKRIIRHNTNKKIYEIITSQGYIKVTEDHSLLDEDGNHIKPIECIIGKKLLHNREFEGFKKINGESSQEFIENYINKYNYYPNSNGTINFDFCDQEKSKALEIYYACRSLGYYVEIKIEKFDLIKRFIISSSKIRPENYDDFNKIIEINDLGYINDYVYDLETDIGHFHAGVGSLIVKNTDSVFFSPKIYHTETKEVRTDHGALKICIEIGKLAGATICKILPDPQEQVYEKTLWPFIILTKKRYVGNLYEDDDSHFYQKSMGIVLKRRDNAKIVKIVVGGIVDYILNGKPGETSILERNNGAIEYTRILIKQILRGEFSIDKYIISKTLRGQYKNRTSIVHAVLADRIGERDPGNKPDINDRIPYVYVIQKKKVMLQGERVEDPKYVIQNNLELDYLFYITNQIMKPSIQFLELIAHSPEKLFMNYINKEINRRKNVSSIMDYIEPDDNIEKDNNSNKINKYNNELDEEKIQKYCDELFSDDKKEKKIEIKKNRNKKLSNAIQKNKVNNSLTIEL